MEPSASRPINVSTLKRCRKWRGQIPTLRSSTLVLPIFRQQNLRKRFERKAFRFTGSSCENFAREITLRFPTVAAKAQRDRAGLVLAKQLDAARSHILG